LRTTIILGHPGETESDFKMLKEFIKEVRFNRLGTFVYSDEEGTQAYDLQNKVEQKVAIERMNIIMDIQRDISKELNDNLINTKQEVLIDNYDEHNKYYIGRTFRDAPEIDNEVIVNNEKFDINLLGNIASVKISDASEYELYGEIIN